MKLGIAIASALILLVGCSIEDAVRKNDDRYARPGAMDSPMREVYKTYQFKLMDRYRITHQFLFSGCAYHRGDKQPSTALDGTLLYVGQDLIEKDGKSWLRFADGGLFDFDRWVRSIIVESRETGSEGQPREIGLNSVCGQSWWGSSHLLSVRFHKTVEMDRLAAAWTANGEWQTVNRNGMPWRVQKVPLDQLHSPRPNSIGGPYQTWITTLGDSGYSIAFRMGASKDSLNHPQAHAQLEKIYMHLIDSLKVERLQP